MKIGFIVVCRYNSERLPGKILMEIENKPILLYIIERLSAVLQKENIVIATSTESTDDPIVDFCNKKQIQYFRGSLENVSERFLLCAKEYNLDYAVRINGDNLFIDINSIKEMIDITQTRKFNFISNVKDRTFPKGMSIEIVKTSYYENVYKKFTTPAHFEHVTFFLYQMKNTEDHYYYYNKFCSDAKGIHLAIDNPDDFILAQKIISFFNENHTHYGLKEIYPIYKRITKNE